MHLALCRLNTKHLLRAYGGYVGPLRVLHVTACRCLCKGQVVCMFGIQSIYVSNIVCVSMYTCALVFVNEWVTESVRRDIWQRARRKQGCYGSHTRPPRESLRLLGTQGTSPRLPDSDSGCLHDCPCDSEEEEAALPVPYCNELGSHFNDNCLHVFVSSPLHWDNKARQQ